MSDRPASPGLPLRWLAPALLQLIAIVGASAQATPPAVIVEPVRVEDVAPSAEFIGCVEAENVVDIRARIDGFVQARLFDEGRLVAKDQELFQIEKATYEAAVASARASLAGAQATLLDAEGRLQRNQQLRRTQAASQAALDEAQAGRDTAQAAVTMAEAALRQAELNPDYTTIRAPAPARHSPRWRRSPDRHCPTTSASNGPGLRCKSGWPATRPSPSW